MADRIKLVANDTRPQIICSLQTSAGVAIDCTAAQSVKLFFRKEGSSTLLSTLVGVLLTGYLNSDGTITTTSPYNVAGAGGRVSFTWGSGTLNVSAGNYEGEVQITFQDGTIQTVYDLLKFKVRSDLGS